jgi:hypothetical protein
VQKDDRNLSDGRFGGAHRLILKGNDQIDAILDESGSGDSRGCLTG